MKTINAIAAFLITALFFGLALSSFSTMGSSKTGTQTVQSIIIFRFGPDGNVKTTKANIELNDKSNALEVIRDKCNALYDNDKELQQILYKWGGFHSKIESQGYGFHFAFFRPMKRSKLMLRSMIFFRYFNDTDYTKVNNQTIVIGPHKGRVIGFIGYVCFSNRFFGYTVIDGYSVFRIDIKTMI